MAWHDRLPGSFTSQQIACRCGVERGKAVSKLGADEHQATGCDDGTAEAWSMPRFKV